MEGDMIDILEFENILKSEYELHRSLYDLEEEKSNAIVNRDGASIESLTQDQEALLNRISAFESRRNSLIEEFTKSSHFEGIGKITLKDIAVLMDGDSSQRLLQLGTNLKEILNKIKSLQETNQRLLSDNIEFFNMMKSGFKSSITARGYNESGMEESRVIDSIIFNQMI
jgi:flagellar biosynthesis/type III secretory pathway chaperone